MVFDEENYEAGWLGVPPFNDLLNLKPYIPQSVWSKDEGLGDCLINGQLLCLRNDNAANVLWVNTKLFHKFFPGQNPPTTWQQYAADGQTLIKNDPGYYIGEFGQPWDAETYLWGNECPINEAIASRDLARQRGLAQLHDDREAPRQGPEGVHEATARSRRHGSRTRRRSTWSWTSGRSGRERRSIPSGSSSEGPGTNVMEAYPTPVATNGAHVTGSIGGGLWMVTSHTTQPAAAAALVEYMDTSPQIQQNPKITQGLPAYAPDQNGWLKSLKGVFANSAATEAAIKQAAAEIWTGWSPVPWSVESIFGNTCTPGLIAGGTFLSALNTLANNIHSAAQSAGWQVKS